MVVINNKPWVDQGPFKLLVTPQGKRIEGISPLTVSVATEMSLAHNVFIRNLNAIYLQAPNIKLPLDIRDFLIFCQTFVEAIHHHHKVEEKYFFPAIEEYTGSKGLMEVNVHQHEAFEAGLDKFTEYVGAAAPEEFDGKKLIEIIDSFGEVLMGHLNDEINTLLGLEEYGGEKLRAAWDLLEKKIQGELGFKDMFRLLPSGLAANDVGFEDGRHHKWPPLPFFMPYLTQYVFARKHRGSWRFGPCTIFGKPKELPFANEINGSELK